MRQRKASLVGHAVFQVNLPQFPFLSLSTNQWRCPLFGPAVSQPMGLVHTEAKGKGWGQEQGGVGGGAVFDESEDLSLAETKAGLRASLRAGC